MCKRFIVLICILTLFAAGCGKPGMDTAGLTPAAEEALERWGLPARATSQGSGNMLRVVTGHGLGASEALEMAAGAQGKISYRGEIEAGQEATASFRVQFLSTQGTGRIYIELLDQQGTAIGAAGWLFTGALPQSDPAHKWQDVRYQANYMGDWINFRLNISDFLQKQLPNNLIAKASRYRLVIESGEGQHALVSQAELTSDWSRAVRIEPVQAAVTMLRGDSATIGITVENTSRRVIPALNVEAVEPYGFGLSAESEQVKTITGLQPGEKRTLSWQFKAQRADAVNLGQPWQLRFKANEQILPQTVQASIQDTRPGKIFYVMTEDLEPIDSAGYPTAWGNGNSWLDPEELTVQMAGKSEALNAIAQKYGAKWTHYVALPVLEAAEWAAARSSTGRWQTAVQTVKDSIRRQAAEGHEYAVHLHIDYDPNLPGNVLSYNGEVDGLWANHLRHGWSHSILAEGDFNDPASRTGSLYHYQAIADKLSAESPLGQLITARVGSFDFGNGEASEAISIRAYHKAGLWGTTDADGNMGGITSGDYGREIYLSKPDDINRPAEDITAVGLVEFRPTPRSLIMYDGQKTVELNRKADEGIQYFTEGTAVKPGVHAISGFTHAMFVMGAGDWRSLQGGQYSEIEQHLAYLKSQYVDAGRLVFGTANDLVKAYLDYYTPVPVAVYGVCRTSNIFYSEYDIQILGSDIPLSSAKPYQVSIKYPLYLRDSAYRISILKNDHTIFSTSGLPTPYNDIVFPVDDHTAAYRMKVYHNRTIMHLLEFWRTVKKKFL